VSSASLTDKLFWPAVAFATVALGGFGYFAATKMSRSTPAVAAWAPLDRTSRTTYESPQPTETAAPSGVEVSVVTETAPAETEPAPAAPTAADAMDADDPFKVPDHKPFITADTFKKPVPPRPIAAPKKPVVPAKQVVAAKTPAAVASKPMVPAAPASKVPLSSEIKVPSLPSTPAPPTYVMNDGRRIAAVKVVDLGEFWGLKTPSGSIVSVRKEDVKEIAR